MNPNDRARSGRFVPVARAALVSGVLMVAVAGFQAASADHAAVLPCAVDHTMDPAAQTGNLTPGEVDVWLHETSRIEHVFAVDSADDEAALDVTLWHDHAGLAGCDGPHHGTLWTCVNEPDDGQPCFARGTPSEERPGDLWIRIACTACTGPTAYEITQFHPGTSDVTDG